VIVLRSFPDLFLLGYLSGSLPITRKCIGWKNRRAFIKEVIISNGNYLISVKMSNDISVSDVV